MNNEAEDAINATSILVTYNGIYALAVTNTGKANIFSQSLNYSSSQRNELRKNYKEKVQVKALKNCNCVTPSPVFEQLILEYLIEFLITENTGLTLYSATINTDGTLTWTALP